MQFLRRRAKVVLVGLFGGELKLNLISMPTKSYRIIGSYTGNIQDMAELVSLAKRKVINPVISDSFKLNQATDALTKLKEGKITGRVCHKSLTIKTINPATEETIQEYDNVTKGTILNKTKKAKEEFYDWKKDLHKRVSFLQDFAQQLRKDKETLAKTATIEMGKPIKESRSEIEKCAWAIEYFADNGSTFCNKGGH